ncbi:MAG TPA: LysE family translocator [Methylomirabilota bacterium]|nr:LysE family translocator [Methylomirabilota bacterium]
MDPQLLVFVGVATLLTVTPGPDTMLVMRNVLARGRRAGLLTTAGISAGIFVHATLSALGVSLILARSALAFEVVKLAGAGYLIVLGAQSLLRLRRPDAAAVPDGPAPAGGGSRSLVEGLLTNLLNPKVAIFYLSFLPQFIRVTDAVLTKSLLLAAIHVGMGVVWLLSVSVFVGALRGLLERRRVRRMLEGVTAAVLVGLGVRLALERR